MTTFLRSRFPPYTRWVLGADIELLSQEGQVSETVTPLQAIALASDLITAARTVLDQEARAVPIAVDWTFIEELEGGLALKGYVPRVNDGGNESGVTIGGGCDLGYWSVAQLRRRKVPEHIIRKIEPYLGLRGTNAEGALTVPLVLSEDDARTLTQRIRQDILAALESRYDRTPQGVPFRFLPQQAQTVIASVAFQFGPNLASATPNFWHQVTARDWRAAHANLRNFGDAYPTRRRKEAAYLADLIA